jgi:hypothetical protein
MSNWFRSIRGRCISRVPVIDTGVCWRGQCSGYVDEVATKDQVTTNLDYDEEHDEVKDRTKDKVAGTKFGDTA